MTHAELRALLAKATQGPWAVRKEEYDSHEAMTADTGKAYAHGGHVLHYLVADGGIFPAFTGNGPTSKANAEYLSAMHAALPALLDVAAASKPWAHCSRPWLWGSAVDVTNEPTCAGKGVPPCNGCRLVAALAKLETP